jgi:hypothetical protein
MSNMLPITDNKKPGGRPGSLQSKVQPEYTAAGRCVACLSPTLPPWHRYCRACHCWLRFADGLRAMQAATKALRA